mgnify:CR=1 FL=1
MVTQENDLPGENESHMIGLRAAITILKGWKATRSQIQKILGISSYALDRVTAGNAANVYGFMRRPNDNDFFNGRAPLDVIAEGRLQDLVETHRRIESLSNGTW